MDASISQTQSFIRRANTLVRIFEDQFRCSQTNKQQDRIEACATCIVTLTQLFELFNHSHTTKIIQSHIDNDRFVVDSIRNLHAISKLFVPKFISFSKNIKHHEPDIQGVVQHMKTQAQLFSIKFNSI